MDRQLPPGWVAVTLAQITRVRTERADPNRLPPHAEIAYFGGRGEERRRFQEVDPQHLIVHEGDILIPRPLHWVEADRFYHCEKLVNGLGCCSQQFFVLRPEPAINGRYLWHYLRQPSVRGQALTSAIIGSGAPLLRISSVNEVIVAMPSLKEQQRLVEILDTAEQLKVTRVKANSHRTQLMPALFKELVGDVNLIWELSPTKLSQVALIMPGRSFPTQNSTGLGSIPWVRAGDLNDGAISDTRLMLTDEEVSRNGLRLLEAGTVLLGTTGSAVGHTGLLTRSGVASQVVTGIRSVTPAFPDEFLWAWFQVAAHRIRPLASRSNLPYLSRRMVEDIPVPTVDRDEVHRLVGALLELESAKRAASSQSNALEGLFSALQILAFRGDLSDAVSTGPAPRIDQLYDSEVERANQLETAMQRSVWRELSDTQKKVWQMALTFDTPFTVRDLAVRWAEQGAKVPSGEYIGSTLVLLSNMGAVIRSARTKADVWRRPDPESDGEVQI